jgi:hypothetical protein
MAGSNPAFDATAFRTAIKSAMAMGAPTSVQERATFRWVTAKTFNIDDPAGRPYDWGQAPATSTTTADVQIDCAVEFTSTSSTTNAVGQFEKARATITVLDEDYVKIIGADQVILGGDTYVIDFVEPPIGLFEVTIYQVHCSALTGES